MKRCIDCKNERVGEKFITNEGYEIEIIEYFNKSNSTIKFTHNDVIVEKVHMGVIRKGSIRNHFHRSVVGVGYIGIGSYKSFPKNNIYNTWICLLNRCYKSCNNSRSKTYIDVKVCEEWHNFQNFAKWFEENWNYNFMDSSWTLDKDILIKGNNIYSPETCCFVPHEINALFIKTKSKRGEYPIGVTKRDKKNRQYIACMNTANKKLI